jgi:hypothetical protein
VYILRWYWWRINAWSEISAMVTALVISIGLRFVHFQATGSLLFAETALITTGLTTVVWIMVTLLTAPEKNEVLLSFYRKVRPQITGWKPVAARAADVPPTRDLASNLGSWVLGCGMVYSTLFGTGKLLFGIYRSGVLLLMVAGICATLLYRKLSSTPEPATTAAEAQVVS